MNPFLQAANKGYSADEILKFAANAIPGFSKNIKEALAIGYSADEILKFLQNAFQGEVPKSYAKSQRGTSIAETLGPQLPSVERQMRAEKRQKRTGQIIDPESLLLGAGGAALGYATGGVPGAVFGGMEGYKGGQDLIRKYEEAVQRGESLSFEDYLKNIVSTGAKAAGGGALAQQAKSLLTQMQQQAGEGSQDISQPPAQPTQEKSQQPQPVDQQTQPVVQEPQANIQESYDLLKKKGFSGFLEKVVGSVPPQDIVKALKSTFGAANIKDLEREAKKPAEQIIEEAYQYLQSKPQQPTAQAQPQEDITETVEETVEQPQTEIEPRQKLRESLKQQQPILEGYLSRIGKIDVPQEFKKPVSVKEIEALKSSNVRYADYDPSTGSLQVLFSPSGKEDKGRIYEYDNVPKEEVSKFFEGADVVSTTGENRLRAWTSGKTPSLGAAFDEYIKQKDEQGNYRFNPRQVESGKVKDKDLLKVRDADKISIVSQYVESFENLFKEAKKKQRAETLRETMQSLRSLDLDHISALYEEAERELKSTGKKRIKGGKEAEIKRRIQEKVK